MTESEKTKEAIYGLGFIKGILYNGIYADRLGCIDYAISALEEILEYRRIGSLNECRDAMEFWKARQELDTKIEKCMEYEKIGTVEECREAVEKQKPKKPEASDSDFDYYKCPVCGEYIWATDNINDHNYCLNCGQAIDWEESEEE